MSEEENLRLFKLWAEEPIQSLEVYHAQLETIYQAFKTRLLKETNMREWPG